MYDPGDTSTVEASDHQISGDWVEVDNPATYSDRAGPGGSFGVKSASVRIENADGAWAGTSTGIYKGDSGHEWNVLEGEGAYEGLTAVFLWTWPGSTLEGVILPAAFPVPPDPLRIAPDLAVDGAPRRAPATGYLDALARLARGWTKPSPAHGKRRARSPPRPGEPERRSPRSARGDDTSVGGCRLAPHGRSSTPRARQRRGSPRPTRAAGPSEGDGPKEPQRA